MRKFFAHKCPTINASAKVNHFAHPEISRLEGFSAESFFYSDQHYSSTRSHVKEKTKRAGFKPAPTNPNSFLRTFGSTLRGASGQAPSTAFSPEPVEGSP